jgi:hypothetical protein
VPLAPASLTRRSLVQGDTGGRGRIAPHWMPSRRLLAVIAGVICSTLLVIQLASGWHILHSSTGFFTAELARHYVWADVVAATLIMVVAVAAPARWRWLAAGGPAAALLVVLLATAIPGGQAVAMLWAVLTMAALWDTGERLLRALGAPQLARIALVAWLAGIGPWSLGTLLLGRLSLLRWWTIGFLVIVAGLIGCARLSRQIHSHRRLILREIGSPTGLVSSGLILLTCVWAAIYTAAPEIQVDALSAKAYLPHLWAQTGHIGSLATHAQLETTGWFQILAVYGHLLGGAAVGRYLQLLGLPLAGAAFWWWGRRHSVFGPLAAAAVVVTPHLFWQASTADDDLLLALCALAMCVAVVEAMRADTGQGVRRVAFVLGLLAGSGPSLKLHMAPLFAALLLAWIGAGRASRTMSSRLLYGALGAAITSLPPLVLRWVDTGNPVLPAYNNIFRSRYWPPVNEKFDFPFWPHPGTLGPLKVIWEAVLDPSLMTQTAPPGAFGIFIGAILFALLCGWCASERSRANIVVWVALLAAVAYWWANVRYLRYLLPVGFVSLALVLMVLRGGSLQGRAQLMGMLGMTLAAIASFPVTLGQFGNVPTHKPPIYAAIGRWKASSYEDAVFEERPAILAFNRLSSPGSLMVSNSFERTSLTNARDLDYTWEVTSRLETQGPLPTTGDQAFRDLQTIGVDWVLIPEASVAVQEPDYLTQALLGHGKIEFAERGWNLYRLVSRPAEPTPLAACDAARAGVPACWGGQRNADGALTAGVTRTVSVCADQTLAISVMQAGGSTSPVVVRFIGGDPRDGMQTGQAVAGANRRVYATTPPGATSADITIGPISGAITWASVGRFGQACSSQATKSSGY